MVRGRLVLLVAFLAMTAGGCSAIIGIHDISAPSDAGSGAERDVVEAGVVASFLGVYACTGSQTQTCSAPGTATGTYDVSAACPVTIVPGSSPSTVVTRSANGVSLQWQLTDATHARLDGLQSIPGAFPNPYGTGVVSSFVFTDGGIVASPGALQIQESGSFAWTSGSDDEACQYEQRCMGSIDGGG